MTGSEVRPPTAAHSLGRHLDGRPGLAARTDAGFVFGACFLLTFKIHEPGGGFSAGCGWLGSGRVRESGVKCRWPLSR